MEHPPARGATRAHWVCVDDTVWALRAVRAVADKALIDRQMTVLPVRLSGQAKPLINSAPRCYPPPHTVAAPPQRHTTSQETTWRPPPPGVSRFRRFRCYLGRPPAPHGPLRHPSLPGMSLFRLFRCYLDRPHAPHGLLRHPSLPGMSLFRRIGSHLRRVTRHPARHYGSGRPGTGSLLRCFCVE